MKLSDLGTVLVGTSSGLFVGNLFTKSMTQNLSDNLFIMVILGLNCWAIAVANAYWEWRVEKKAKP